MPTAPVPARPVSVRAFAALVTGVVVLIAMFVAVPGPLAAGRWSGGLADQDTLRDTLRTAFVEYWASGRRPLTPALQAVVDYWFRFHVVKAGIALLALGVLIVLGRRLGRAFATAGRRPGARVGLGAAGVGVALLGLLALVSVVANVQGAAAPFASLLPMLMSGPHDGATASTLNEVRARLAAGTPHPLPLAAMIDDFAWYHAALAVVVVIVAAAVLVIGIVLWRRRPAADRPARRLLVACGAAAILSSLAFTVVGVANTLTAVDPAPALAAFFAGGW
ncbi:hypothetical protein [Hamadaea tsunoensis]|uniref:hypothetical protein n=1 Tax=Hamadaea tsunoensis TaxID=53368 RepID=UPI0003FCAA5B|nr:hypothetical protein [Hamadaea tsunoensis]